MTPLIVNLAPVFELTDEAFYQLCQNNSDIRFERTAKGELVIMPPVGGEGGKREADLTIDLGVWNRQAQLGVVFSSSAGFKLPNGAVGEACSASVRSPDAAWVSQARWDALPLEQRRRFPPLAPDFVIELRSETDEIEPLQAKMREYMDNGVRLGWLIDPKTRRVEIYSPDQPPEIFENPGSLSGEDLLPGFVLDLSRIFA